MFAVDKANLVPTNTASAYVRMFAHALRRSAHMPAHCAQACASVCAWYARIPANADAAIVAVIRRVDFDVCKHMLVCTRAFTHFDHVTDAHSFMKAELSLQKITWQQKYAAHRAPLSFAYTPAELGCVELSILGQAYFAFLPSISNVPAERQQGKRKQTKQSRRATSNQKTAANQETDRKCPQ